MLHTANIHQNFSCNFERPHFIIMNALGSLCHVWRSLHNPLPLRFYYVLTPYRFTITVGQ